MPKPTVFKAVGFFYVNFSRNLHSKPSEKRKTLLRIPSNIQNQIRIFANYFKRRC